MRRRGLLTENEANSLEYPLTTQDGHGVFDPFSYSVKIDKHNYQYELYVLMEGSMLPKGLIVASTVTHLYSQTHCYGNFAFAQASK